MQLESGDFRDNLMIFEAALGKFRAGDADEALWILVELRRLILQGTDIQSRVWLILKIDEAIPVVHSRCRGNEPPRAEPPIQTPRRRRPWAMRVDSALLRWAAVISLAFTIVKVLAHEYPRLRANALPLTIEDQSHPQDKQYGPDQFNAARDCTTISSAQ